MPARARSTTIAICAGADGKGEDDAAGSGDGNVDATGDGESDGWGDAGCADATVVPRTNASASASAAATRIGDVDGGTPYVSLGATGVVEARSPGCVTSPDRERAESTRRSLSGSAGNSRS